MGVKPTRDLGCCLFESGPVGTGSFSPGVSFLSFVSRFSAIRGMFCNRRRTPSRGRNGGFGRVCRVIRVGRNDPLPFEPPFEFLIGTCRVTKSGLRGVFKVLGEGSRLSGDFRGGRFKSLARARLTRCHREISGMVC